MYIYIKKESDTLGSLENYARGSCELSKFIESLLISDYDGIPYIHYTGDLEALRDGSKLLKEFFLKATIRAYPEYVAPRKTGIYVYGKAKAELVYYTSNKRGAYTLEIETKSWSGLGDMETIQQKIYAGTIAPVISYENEQKKQNAFDVLRGMLLGHKLTLIKRFILAWRLMLEGIK